MLSINILLKAICQYMIVENHKISSVLEIVALNGQNPSKFSKKRVNLYLWALAMFQILWWAHFMLQENGALNILTLAWQYSMQERGVCFHIYNKRKPGETKTSSLKLIRELRSQVNHWLKIGSDALTSKEKQDKGIYLPGKERYQKHHESQWELSKVHQGLV